MAHRHSRPNFFVCQQENAGHLGVLEDVLRSAGCDTTVFNRKGDTSRSFDPAKHAGLIVLGGDGDHADKRGAYDEEKEWVGQALRLGRPVLGICLGAQLLVQERGGVYRGLVRGGEYGWKRVILTQAGKKDPVLRHLTSGCEMLQWHQDWCEPASGAVNLALPENTGERSAAFRIGMNAYGVQFHPELTREMLKQWLSPRRRTKWMKETEQRLEECFPCYSETARNMLGAWVQLALANSRE
jgi:GMP synthase (glutamine-hydrolysing)